MNSQVGEQGEAIDLAHMSFTLTEDSESQGGASAQKHMGSFAGMIVSEGGELMLPNKLNFGPVIPENYSPINSPSNQIETSDMNLEESIERLSKNGIQLVNSSVSGSKSQFKNYKQYIVNKDIFQEEVKSLQNNKKGTKSASQKNSSSGSSSSVTVIAGKGEKSLLRQDVVSSIYQLGGSQIQSETTQTNNHSSSQSQGGMTSVKERQLEEENIYEEFISENSALNKKIKEKDDFIDQLKKQVAMMQQEKERLIQRVQEKELLLAAEYKNADWESKNQNRQQQQQSADSIKLATEQSRQVAEQNRQINEYMKQTNELVRVKQQNDQLQRENKQLQQELIKNKAESFQKYEELKRSNEELLEIYDQKYQCQIQIQKDQFSQIIERNQKDNELQLNKQKEYIKQMSLAESTIRYLREENNVLQNNIVQLQQVNEQYSHISRFLDAQQQHYLYNLSKNFLTNQLILSNQENKTSQSFETSNYNNNNNNNNSSSINNRNYVFNSVTSLPNDKQSLPVQQQQLSINSNFNSPQNQQLQKQLPQNDKVIQIHEVESSSEEQDDKIQSSNLSAVWHNPQHSNWKNNINFNQNNTSTNKVSWSTQLQQPSQQFVQQKSKSSDKNQEKLRMKDKSKNDKSKVQLDKSKIKNSNISTNNNNNNSTQDKLLTKKVRTIENDNAQREQSKLYNVEEEQQQQQSSRSAGESNDDIQDKDSSMTSPSQKQFSLQLGQAQLSQQYSYSTQITKRNHYLQQNISHRHYPSQSNSSASRDRIKQHQQTQIEQIEQQVEDNSIMNQQKEQGDDTKKQQSLPLFKHETIKEILSKERDNNKSKNIRQKKLKKVIDQQHSFYNSIIASSSTSLNNLNKTLSANLNGMNYDTKNKSFFKHNTNNNNNNKLNTADKEDRNQNQEKIPLREDKKSLITPASSYLNNNQDQLSSRQSDSSQQIISKTPVQQQLQQQQYFSSQLKNQLSPLSNSHNSISYNNVNNAPNKQQLKINMQYVMNNKNINVTNKSGILDDHFTSNTSNINNSDVVSPRTLTQRPPQLKNKLQHDLISDRPVSGVDNHFTDINKSIAERSTFSAGIAATSASSSLARDEVISKQNSQQQQQQQQQQQSISTQPFSHNSSQNNNQINNASNSNNEKQQQQSGNKSHSNSNSSNNYTNNRSTKNSSNANNQSPITTSKNQIYQKIQQQIQFQQSIQQVQAPQSLSFSKNNE